MQKKIILSLALLAPFSGLQTAHATCWQEASLRYDVPITLLKAIAFVESSNRARIVAQNTNGSLDYGFMQINDFWLPELSKYRIGTRELMDACTSVNVGAWILAQNFQQMGYNWNAVGAYGAGTKKAKATARSQYAAKVQRAMADIESGVLYSPSTPHVQKASYQTTQVNTTNQAVVQTQANAARTTTTAVEGKVAQAPVRKKPVVEYEIVVMD